ncbi:MAG: bifunctional folylpolyglutamate synthase/dihydrofolate synthase [Lachnospiraceae bacterium]|nr:bifunctional folylpolyglutamate synthase/dihydrofolate synthase [Lachnospiraceae bacterium]
MMNYQDAVDYIDQIPKYADSPVPAHTFSLMELLGNPQDSLKVIHVAGTNGKGSICAYITEMLVGQGCRVGTFTSPHLVRMNERIKVNNVPVEDEAFLDAFLRVKDASERLGDTNYFEYLFAMAMLIYQEAGLDYAVLEVGLGGRKDATNVIKHPAVSVIASISLDHTEVLGDTIAQIAFEKAGIIKEGCPVVYDGCQPEASAVFEAEAAKLHAPAYGVDHENWTLLARSGQGLSFQVNEGFLKGHTIQVPFIAGYQAANAMVALSALNCLNRLGTEEEIDQALSAITRTVWPGRMQQVYPGVYLDGAHNSDGILHFVETVASMPCAGKKYLLFTAVKEKDLDHMTEFLAARTDFSGIFVTELDHNSRAVSAESLAEKFRRFYDGPVYVCPHIKDAWEQAMEIKKEQDILFIAGSLYLVGSVMEACL